MTPEDREYSAAHVWIREERDGSVRLGLTHVPARFLGDAVYAELLPPGADISAGEPIGLVESSSTVFEVVAPVGGAITEINPAAESSPEKITADPYGDGWLVLIRPSSGEKAPLLCPADYALLAGD